IARSAVDHLVTAWKTSRHIGWDWFEPQMTYANAVLPHAMFDAAERWPDEEFLSIAEKSFRFLDEATTTNNVFWPIGNDGWYARHAEKSLYDQQPVEASTMAAAALRAFQMRHEDQHLVAFQKAHGWFHGRNSMQYQMADTESGGCHDGLEVTGANRNQGAESTLAFLWTEVLALEANRETPAIRTGTSARPFTLSLHDQSVVH
ncbi:MAG: glycosyltransferase, partial [Planctomycetaceae bacterium]